MAYTKKNVENSEATALNEQTKAEPVSTVKKKEKKVFTDSDYILCRSVWYGGLNITCQSGNTYEFRDYGKECEINYRDLVSLIRKNSDHVFLPRFVIIDDDLVEEFPALKRVYSSMYTNSDLLSILDLPISAMKAEIDKLPPEPKSVLSKMISTEISNGHLDSISKVRALSDIFDSDFNLLSQLFVRK